ncbi:MAG: hypothetical protein H3C62_05235, partial [Gemmatimonadaceae bacterium]|nr:hypothetical protein [Gemmatimonadaceae bacterium]
MTHATSAEIVGSTLDKVHRARYHAFRALHGQSVDTLLTGNPWMLAMQGVIRWQDAEALGRGVTARP